MACAEISEKADARNETCPWKASAEWCKEYATAELMFREGFPDHLNRSYPLSADSLRRCNRKCRIYMQ